VSADALDLGRGARALFSERADGNLSPRTGTSREQAARARERLRERLALDALSGVRQLHGRGVHVVSAPAGAIGEPARREPEADGVATALRSVGAVVLTADCLPVAIAADGAVAVAHAGWRGLAAGVLEQTVQTLRAIARAGPIAAVVGPGARVCCYEVGAELHAAFPAASRRGTRLDLPAIALGRLRAAGVAALDDLGVCTICDPRFFSHRREGASAGRQAGVAWLT
jgi:purine-nucleoside/S-methyl-5'-thioadenosine phosphorylase / adenosine deaminase